MTSDLSSCLAEVEIFPKLFLLSHTLPLQSLNSVCGLSFHSCPQTLLMEFLRSWSQLVWLMEGT